jgi:hypothetical protein
VNKSLNGVLKMNRFSKALAASALALGLSALAAPSMASSVIFADYDTGASNARNFIFTSTGDDATFSTTATASGGAGAANVFFSYLGDPSLSGFFDLPAQLDLHGTVTDTAASFNGVNYTQTGLNGEFSFVFNGADGTVVNGHTLHNTIGNRTVLFSGNFSNAFVSGSTGVGGIEVTVGNGGHANYFSDFYDLSKFTDFEYTFHLGAVNPAFGATPGNTLNSFRAHVAGEFQGVVPEPATWALMILGFGGAGAMLRSQRRRAFAL